MIEDDELREMFAYDPDTGIVERVSGRRGFLGPVGTKNGKGYLTVLVRRRPRSMAIQVHRLAWMLHYGEWPKNEIDHIDGNKTNNRLENLRDVCRAVNVWNPNTQKNKNSSLPMGVSRINYHGKVAYAATVRRDGKTLRAVVQSTEEAVRLKDKFYNELYPEFHQNVEA